ncbi:MAG: penicillin-binding transpeptidase domain-containing protein, partial [Actinomycetota bacterium]
YYGSSALERTFNDVLLGYEPQRRVRFLDELFGREPAGNTLKLSIEPALQRVARDALGGQRGGAAVIDSETGAILGLYGNPSYDPNPLAKSPRHEEEIRKAWTNLVNAPGDPLVSRAFSQRYPPGSTFKVVVAAAALINGMTPDTTFPDPRRLDLPDTNRTLGNYQNGSCVGGRISMRTALRVSCNTTFAQIAMRIGAEKLGRAAGRFGIGRKLDIGIDTAPSCLVAVPGAACQDPGVLSRPATAYSGIGQQDVRMTPLQMAVVAAAAGNGGFRVEPRLVERIYDPIGETIAKSKPERTRILPKKAAASLKSMMIDTVRFGTGAVVGFKDASRGIIGGKTGTAETGVQGQFPHVWFVAFGPKVAVAVVVENGGDAGGDATGGRVAGPIAKRLLEKAMQLQAQREAGGTDDSDLPQPGPSFPTTSPSPSEAP